MESLMSRRNFVKGAGSAMAAGAVFSATALAAEAPAAASYMPEAWDQETEILVVGHGGAGISAGITVADEGLGECLVIDAAPEGVEGGNTYESGQCIFCPDTVEGAVEYQTYLNGPYEVEPELMQAWAENLCANVEWLTGLGINLEEFKRPGMCPEYPGVPGADSCNMYLVDGIMRNHVLSIALAEVAEDLGVTIQCDTRAVELVFDPATKEVFGVKALVGPDQKEIYIKARKAVILACGGFEYDPELIKEFNQIGLSELVGLGTVYNRGDGIRMAQQVGAKLWHMNNFSMSHYGFKYKDTNHCGYFAFDGMDYIYVGPNAQRFVNEESNVTAGLSHHGKESFGGIGMNWRIPEGAYVVFGSSSFGGNNVLSVTPTHSYVEGYDELCAMTNEDLVADGFILKGETAEELAEQMGVHPATLAKTIADYNENAAANVDPQYHRGEPLRSSFVGAEAEPAVIEAYDLQVLEPPFYAFPIKQMLLNSQGGPKRAANGQIVDMQGAPIPRLFGAGELGCVYSYNYNGGGNVGEAMASGRLAARSAGALEPWE